MIRIDLHSHTTHSDGMLAPEKLLARAEGAGVSHLGVTDHDTVAGVLPAARAAHQRGIELVPGIEMTVFFSGRECHILGLGLCPLWRRLMAWCDQRTLDRRQRIEHMITALAKLNVHVTLDEVVAESSGQTLARPHLARVLIKRGYVDSMQAAFDRYLTRRDIGDREWPRPSSAEAIELIHEAGGVASIAHPGVNRVSSKELKQLADEGLDAVEAFHHEHDPSQAGTFQRWARDLGLQCTGGSDFHGGIHAPAELGAYVTPFPQWQALNARSEARGESPALSDARRQWLAAKAGEAPNDLSP